MKRNIFIFSAFLFLLAITSCSSKINENTTANVVSNTNAAVTVNNNTNPIANINTSIGTATGNSSIPGIPNAPATDKSVSKDDPTRNAKPQTISRPGPDNSEIFGPTLGEDLVETRVFKNNAQIAKIDVIGTDKKTVKVYLRNGQVRELPEGKISDPLSESAANIIKVLAGNAEESKTATKKSQTTTAAGKPKN